MKKLMTLTMLLMAFALSAQQFPNIGFEETLQCIDDCEIANSQMTCVPGWNAMSNTMIKYVQKTSCEGDIVCTDDISILLSTDEDQILGISVDNPIEEPDILGIPEVVSLTTRTLPGSHSSTGIIISGNDGTNTVELGTVRPSAPNVCENLTFLLYDNDFSHHSFPTLEVTTGPANGSNVTFTHNSIVDDIELCGPLFTIEDNCTELIINFADCDLASFIHTARIFINGPNGSGCEQIDVSSANFDVPVVCNIDEIGVYFIEVGLSYNFNPDLLADLYTVQYEVTCCDQPVPNYKYVDDEGIEKEEFCFGEDVILDTEGTANQDRWFLSIWQYNVGGLAAGENSLAYCRIFPGTPQPIWAQGEIPPTIPLNPIWADCFGTQGFEPGFEYRVQLAVTSDCFGGWHVKEDDVFTVVCCDEYAADPCFSPSNTDFEDDHYTIEAILYDQYQNLNAEHEWYVYTQNEDGTFNQLDIIYDPVFSYEPAAYGVEYFIIHKVITACDEICFQTSIKVGLRPEEPERNEGEERTVPCPGEIIDCSLIDEIFPPCSDMVAPTNLQVVNGMLTWTPVPGAETYSVFGQIGGITACECGGDIPISINLGTTDLNSIPVPDNLLDRCFQWTVVANCTDGVSSLPSEPACHYPVMLRRTDNNKESLGTGMRETISLNPNPAKDYFDIYNNSTEEIFIELYNTNGQLIQVINNIQAEDRTTVDTKQWIPGLYFLTIKNQTNNAFISSQKIIIRR